MLLNCDFASEKPFLLPEFSYLVTIPIEIMKKLHKPFLALGLTLAVISCSVPEEHITPETTQNSMKFELETHARFSDYELNETLERINSLLECKSGTSELDNISNLYVDEKSNCIKVGLVEDDEKHIAEFKSSIFDSPALIFERASRVITQNEPEEELRRNSLLRKALLISEQPSHELRAWDQIWGRIANNDSINSASVGYRAQTYSGQKGFVTSAHAIMRLHDSVYIKDAAGRLVPVGYVQKRQNGGKVDAAFCSIDESKVTVTNILYANTFPKKLYPPSIELPAIDQEVRLFGAISSKGKGYQTQGAVVATNCTFIGFGNVVYTNMVKATYPSYGGDCGGVIVSEKFVVVDPRRLVGIHLGRQDGYSYFVPANTINSTFGLTVY